MNDGPIAFAVGVFLALLFVALCYHDCQLIDECERRGGRWYQPYKSQGVCLKRGTFID